MPSFTPSEASDIKLLLRTRGRAITFRAGAQLFAPGMPCSHFLVLGEGRVQVRMVSESGREIVLYRIGPGETCIMTTACLMAQEPYAAEGFAETDCRASALPACVFDELIASSSNFRRFVFKEHGKRLRAMMTTLDGIAFQRLDTRLAALLCRSGNECLQVTHQMIADELGTAREVVSRLMKEMETRGWISQKRGSVAILDRNALLKLSATRFSPLV